MINHDYINLDFDDLPLKENGVLQVLANLTRTGVFTYFQKDPDGTVRIIRQLRHPDEVFAETTMQTLMGLPTTNNHPSEMEVNPNNVSDYIVGMTSDQPKRVLAPVQGDKEEYVQQQVTFFDKKTINDMVHKKKRELSLGYTCYLDEKPGEWNGQKYDVIQRDIRYNHLSIVDRGRAGASCRVLLDSQSEEIKKQLNTVCDGLTFIDNTDLIDGKNIGDNMKILIIDGAEHKVSDEVYEAYHKAVKETSEMKKVIDSHQQEKDKLQAEVDETKEKLETKNDSEEDIKKFNDAVDSRVKLISKCITVLGDSEDFSGVSDIDLKVKCIKAIRKDINLDGKSDAYIDARFDVVMEDYKPGVKKRSDDLGRNLLNNDNVDNSSSETKRKEAWERDKELWKTSFKK